MDTLEGVSSLKTEGYEGEQTLTASLDLTRPAVALRAPTGRPYSISRDRLKACCLEVLSNPFPRWPEILGPNPDPMTGGAELVNPRSTAALQVVVSLFHLSYALALEQELHPGEPIGALATRLCGRRLEDMLPPRNALLVPSAGLQERIQAEDHECRLFKLERLYRCEISAQDGRAIFHYRPYNTPIVRRGELGAMTGLYDDLKREYETLE